MFQKGDYVVSGSKGVCMVEDVTTLDLTGVDRKRKYYILKPVYLKGSTVYVPVDSAEGSLRPVLSRAEADKLLRGIGEIPLITSENDKSLEQEYKDCLRANNCKECIRVIKTICLRRQKRLAAGRKVTALDAKYFRLAEDNLCGELAVSLQMPLAEVEKYITKVIDQ